MNASAKTNRGNLIGTPALLGVSASRLEESASVDEVMQRLDDLVRPYRAGITSIRLFCHEHARDSVLCSVNAPASAPAIARAIGGIVFGFSMACRNLHLAKDDFRCPNRHRGTFLKPVCGKCSREYLLTEAAPGGWLATDPEKPGTDRGLRSGDK